MLSGYRIMWVMVMFDLPTNTKGERAAASNFRNDLKDLGFEMVQYSVYIRFCGSQSKADTTITAIQWRAGEHSAIHRQAVRGHPHLHGRAANRPENASRTARNVLGRSKFQFQKSQYPLRCRGYCIYESIGLGYVHWPEPASAVGTCLVSPPDRRRPERFPVSPLPCSC